MLWSGKPYSLREFTLKREWTSFLVTSIINQLSLSHSLNYLHFRV